MHPAPPNPQTGDRSETYYALSLEDTHDCSETYPDLTEKPRLLTSLADLHAPSSGETVEITTCI